MSTAPWWLKATDSCGVAYPRMFSNHFLATAEGFALCGTFNTEDLKLFKIFLSLLNLYLVGKKNGEIITPNQESPAKLPKPQCGRQRSKYFKSWYFWFTTLNWRSVDHQLNWIPVINTNSQCYHLLTYWKSYWTQYQNYFIMNWGFPTTGVRACSGPVVGTKQDVGKTQKEINVVLLWNVGHL